MNGYTTLRLVDLRDKYISIEIQLPDGRIVELRPRGDISRSEALAICRAIMNCMRAGLRADQFRYGTVLEESSPS